MFYSYSSLDSVRFNGIQSSDQGKSYQEMVQLLAAEGISNTGLTDVASAEEEKRSFGLWPMCFNTVSTNIALRRGGEDFAMLRSVGMP